MIRRKNGKYAVFSHTTGRKLSRWYPTKSAAVQRLREIKGFASRDSSSGRATKRGKMY